MERNKIVVNDSVSDLEFQGITIAAKKMESVEQIPEEVPPHTGTATRKPNGSSDNPEKPVSDQNKPALTQNKSNQEESGTFWSGLSKWQKGLLIGFAVMCAIGLVVGLTLLICALAWKPVVTSTSSGTLNVPGSKQALNIKEVKIYDKNVVFESVSASVQVDAIYGAQTIESPTRMLQEEEQKQEPPIGFMTILDENKGITLKAESPSSFTAEVDLDAALIYYSNTNAGQSRRLLQYMEMRLLQQSVVNDSNSLRLDDVQTLRSDAEASLVKGVANVFGEKAQDLVVEYSDTAVGQLNSEGLYVLQTETTPQTSSRLLYVMQRFRMLGQLQFVFDDLNKKVIEPELLRSINIIRNYGDEIAKEAQVTFDNGELLVAVEEVTDRRVLQQDSSSTTPVSNSNDSPAPSISTPSTTAIGSTLSTSPGSSTLTTADDDDEDAQNPSKSKKGLKRPKKPKRPNQRRVKPPRKKPTVRAQNQKTRVINEQTLNASTKCTGPRHRRRCSLDEFNSSRSPHKTKDNQAQQVRKRPNHRIIVDPERAKQRRERIRRDRQQREKLQREKQQRDKQQREKQQKEKLDKQKKAKEATNTPTAPTNPSTPTTPSSTPSTPTAPVNPSPPTTPVNPSPPPSDSSSSTVGPNQTPANNGVISP